MAKITKSDLVDNIYKTSEYERKAVRAVVDDFLLELKKQLSEGNTIELRGLGTFEPLLRNGRKEARNPKTGEKCTVPPHYIAHFRAGQELKDDMSKLPVEKKGR